MFNNEKWKQIVQDQSLSIPKTMEEMDKQFADWIQGIPNDYKSTMIDVLEQLMITLANFTQKPSRITEQEKKVLLEARLFNDEIDVIEKMNRLTVHQLEYIEDKWRSKYALYSMLEGGIAGTGHILSLLLDVPVLLTLNLNMIQCIASTYGYSLCYADEQVLAIKVLHASTLAKNYRQQAWEWIIDEYHQKEEFSIYINEEESIVQNEWLETIAKQFLKDISLFSLRKSTSSKVSLVGVAIGAGLNYQLTKEVGEFASEFYKYRYNLEKQKDENI